LLSPHARASKVRLGFLAKTALMGCKALPGHRVDPGLLAETAGTVTLGLLAEETALTAALAPRTANLAPKVTLGLLAKTARTVNLGLLAETALTVNLAPKVTLALRV
jgi:hypothetical protein